MAALDRLALPDRKARVADGFSLIHLKMDVCRNLPGLPLQLQILLHRPHVRPLVQGIPEERIVKDLENIKKQGTEAVFIVDDNINFDIDHFRMV